MRWVRGPNMRTLRGMCPHPVQNHSSSSHTRYDCTAQWRMLHMRSRSGTRMQPRMPRLQTQLVRELPTMRQRKKTVQQSRQRTHRRVGTQIPKHAATPTNHEPSPERRRRMEGAQVPMPNLRNQLAKFGPALQVCRVRSTKMPGLHGMHLRSRRTGSPHHRTKILCHLQENITKQAPPKQRTDDP